VEGRGYWDCRREYSAGLLVSMCVSSELRKVSTCSSLRWRVREGCSVEGAMGRALEWLGAEDAFSRSEAMGGSVSALDWLEVGFGGSEGAIDGWAAAMGGPEGALASLVRWLWECSSSPPWSWDVGSCSEGS